MNIIKKFFSIIIVIILFSGTCFAQEEVLVSDSLENSIEKNEVQDVISNSGDFINQVLPNDGNGSLKRLKAEGIFKCYYLNTLYISDYNKVNNFDKLISSKYDWIIPINNENQKLVSSAVISKGMTEEEANKVDINNEAKKDFIDSVKKHAGKWHISKIGPILPNENLTFMSNKKCISDFLEKEGLKNASKIKYVNLGRYRVDMLYIKHGSDEYGIAVTARPDLIGLESGKLYRVSEIVDKLSVFDNSNSKGLGGLGNINNLPNTHNKIVVPVLFFLIITFLCVSIGIIFKRRSINNQLS